MKQIKDYPLCFTPSMKLCFILREDFYPTHLKNKSILAKQKYFAMWWVAHAANEYPQHFVLTEDLKAFASEVINIRFKYPINRFMDFILQSRQDLRDLYSTENEKETEKFIAWYYIYGLKEYNLISLLSEQEINRLAAPYSDNNQDIEENSGFYISHLMHLIWSQREDLKSITSLQTQEEINWFIKWFYIQGCKELDLFRYIDKQTLKKLTQAVTNTEQSPNHPISYLMYIYHSYDPHINKKYDLNNPQHRTEFYVWFTKKGAKDNSLDKFLDSPETSLKSTDKVSQTNAGKPKKKGRFGINLVGYATGDLGIGEDVRMMVKSLKNTDVPFCVINHKPSDKISQSDKSILQYVTKKPIFGITILCMTGLETINLWLKQPKLFEGQHVIGYWPWELPQWPTAWEPAYHVVNEIWASSKYTQNAYSKAPVPVEYMPMAVSIDRLMKQFTRGYFNLPENRFLFLFAFDFMSYPDRKNPYACIKAFTKAFPQGNEKTNLVLKISNLDKSDKHWRKIKKLCQQDPRIIIIKQTFSREEILGLFDVCNAYVSLHCSEGFGRTLAEALLLGKPVIATNFSGNADFISEKNAYPVSYKLKEIKEGEYPGCYGQSWAKVNIKDAALQFSKVYRDAGTLSKSKFKLPKKYNAKVCGSKYSSHLKDIWKKIANE